jgi:hypothetical protein
VSDHAAAEDAWLDRPHPALGGLTPREAAADPDVRPQLLLLLNAVPADPDGPGLDTGTIKQRLGLGDQA